MHGRDDIFIQNFGLKILRGRDHSEDLEVDVKIILELILGKVWTGFIWLRTGSSGGLL
jgi:hypothetical protein